MISFPKSQFASAVSQISLHGLRPLTIPLISSPEKKIVIPTKFQPQSSYKLSALIPTGKVTATNSFSRKFQMEKVR